MNVRMEMDIEYLIRIVNNDMNIKKRFAKNAQLAQSAISGFGMCSQRAGAKIGAGPDLYTACEVVNSHPDTACQFAKPVWVGPACQVVKVWRAVTLTPKTVNVFLAY